MRNEVNGNHPRYAINVSRAGRLNFVAGDMPGGDRGLVSWPARSTEFRDNLDVTIGICAQRSAAPGRMLVNRTTTPPEGLP